MSSGPRIPLASATSIASVLINRLGLSPNVASVVGSVRRKKPDVGDVEIIAPLPEAGQTDKLYSIVKECFGPRPRPSELLWQPNKGEPPANPLGRIIAGCNPQFKECNLELWVKPEHDEALKALADERGIVPVKATIYRYTPGRQGNRGWIELMRTGCAEFGEVGVLSAWKYICGTRGTPKPGSKEGFLVDSQGNPRATPTECHVFGLIGCVWVPPPLRTGPEAICRAPDELVAQHTKTTVNTSPELRARAMRHLGIRDMEELADRWRQDRFTEAAAQH